MSESRKQPSSEQNKRRGLNLKRKEVGVLVGINTLISIIISLLVVLVVVPWVFGGAVSGLPGDNTTQTGPTTQGTPLDQLTPAPLVNNVTPSATPIPEPVVYEVKTGDSLSQIAEKFQVPMDDIMKANGFDDADFVQAGQTLIIPIGGLVEATATFTPIPEPSETSIPVDPPSQTETDLPTPASDISLTPTPTPTPIPTATPPNLDEVSVRITNVLGYGEIERELIVIFNEGPGINLSGWTLTGSTLDDYKFPNLFLWSGGSIRVHTAEGANTHADLYWRKAEPHWFSQDVVELKNANGEVMSTYPIP